MESQSMTTIRRDFLTRLLGAAACGATLDNGCDVVAAAPPDLAQSPAPAADLGSLYPEVAGLASGEEFELSYLQSRFTDWDAYRPQARDVVLDAFAYRPAPVDPEPEIVSADDMGDYIREKIVFSTGPGMRVPAY